MGTPRWRICHIVGIIMTLVGIVADIYGTVLFVSSFSLLPDPPTSRPSPRDNGPREESRPTPTDFCQDKNLLGIIRFGHNSSCVTNEKISGRLVDQLTDLNEDDLVLAEGYASPEGDVLHNLKLSEERAAKVIQYLRCNYPALSEVRFRLLAKGEGLHEAAPNLKNCRDRQVRLYSCHAPILSIQDDPATREPSCDCAEPEPIPNLDSDGPCAEVDNSCMQNKDFNC